MTQDEIIEMAREAGCIPRRHPEYWEDIQVFATPDVIVKFAKLVAAKEREACVKIADEVINSERDRTEEADHNNNESYEGYDDGWFDACNTIKFFVKKQGEA